MWYPMQINTRVLLDSFYGVDTVENGPSEVVKYMHFPNLSTYLLS